MQSIAITRFVAKEVGIAGKNNVEMAQCDAVADFCTELAVGKSQHVMQVIKSGNRDSSYFSGGAS